MSLASRSDGLWGDFEDDGFPMNSSEFLVFEKKLDDGIFKDKFVSSLFQN